MIAMGKPKDKSELDPTKVGSVGLLIGARNRLKEYCDARHGMTLQDVFTSIVEWFVEQPPLVQSVVLRESHLLPRAYADALRAMADQIEKGEGGSSGPGPTRPERPGPTPKKS